MNSNVTMAPGATTCLSCGHQQPADARFCEACGAVQPIEVPRPRVGTNEIPPPPDSITALEDQFSRPMAVDRSEQRRGSYAKRRDWRRSAWFRRSVPITLAVVALLVGVAVGNLSSGARSLRSDLAASRGTAADLKGQVAALTQQLSGQRSQNTSLDSQVSSLTGQLSDLQSDNDSLTTQLAQLRAKRPLPNLVGKDRDAVNALVDQYGWSVSFSEQASSKPEGTVISESPAPGTVMHYGAKLSVVVAKPFPPGWKDIKVWSGSGNSKTELVEVPDGQVRLVYSFSGDFNDVIILMQPPDEWVDLLVNDIGPRSGSTRLYYTGKYFFDIEGGSWTVRLQVWR